MWSPLPEIRSDSKARSFLFRTTRSCSSWLTIWLGVVAATALTAGAEKLSRGQPLEVPSPRQVRAVLGIKGHSWLTGEAK